jgi:hypothetical protein
VSVPSSGTERGWQAAERLLEDRAPRSAGPNRLALLVGLVVTGAIVALVGTQMAGRLVERRTAQWIATTAEVTESHLEEHSQWSTSGRIDQTVNVVIRAHGHYRYTYGGSDYVSDVVSVPDDNEPFQRTVALTLDSARTRGQRITVWVDPKDPRRAIYCRQSSASWAGWLALGLAGALLILALIASGMSKDTTLVVLVGWWLGLLTFAIAATISLYVALDTAWLQSYVQLRALGSLSPVPDPFRHAEVLSAGVSYLGHYPVRGVALILFDLFGAWVVVGMIWTFVRPKRPAARKPRDAQRAQRLGARLRERLADHPASLTVLDLLAEGVTDAQELAQKSGLEIDDARSERERIVDCAERVRDEEQLRAR